MLAPDGREPAEPMRATLSRPISTVHDPSGIERQPGGLRGALRTLRVRLDSLAISSARGHIRALVVLNGALCAATAAAYMVIRTMGLLYFERLTALAFGYGLGGFALSLVGAYAVIVRSTALLGLFVALAYATAFVFSGVSISIASIAIAAYRLGARVLSGACFGLACVFALIVFVWARAAHDARLTRVRFMRGDMADSTWSNAKRLGGGAGLERRRRLAAGALYGRWLASRSAPAPPRASGADALRAARAAAAGDGVAARAVASFASLDEQTDALAVAEGAAAGAAAGAEAHTEPPARPPRAVPRMHALIDDDDDDARPRLRARLSAALLGAPLFVACCLLLYPLVFADSAACDVELLLVGARELVGPAHVAWEGAMGAVFKDENLRPAVRALGVPRAALSGRPFRGVPMLRALSRWRGLGLLRGAAETGPTQVVMCVLRRHDPEPPPRAQPSAPPSPPGHVAPLEPPRCQNDPRNGDAWCEARTRCCGRPPFDARCPAACRLCPPPPPPPPPPTSRARPTVVGTDVPAIGRTVGGCLRAVLQLDELGFRGGRTRLQARGYDSDAIQRIIETRTRGGDPAEAPRTVALAEFDVVCFRAVDLQSDAFWASARAALGDGVVEPPCGATAGVVGGMGPLAGAVYQERLSALFERVDTAAALHAAAAGSTNASDPRADDDADGWTRGAAAGGSAVERFSPTAAEVELVRDAPELAREAAAACVETLSNPQLAVDARALLATVGASQRVLVEQRAFLGRADLAALAGPSNAWYELSYRPLTRAWSIALGPGSSGQPRLINLIDETVARALAQPNLRAGARVGLIATSTTLNGIEQRERLSALGSNLYRLAWEARNAQLQREDPRHVYVELLPVRALRDGPALARIEQHAIGLVKSNNISLARERFGKLFDTYKLVPGVRGVIAGCTEVSVAFTTREVSAAYGLELFDSSSILAQAQFETMLGAFRQRVRRGRARLRR